jgi:hypothetical protein
MTEEEIIKKGCEYFEKIYLNFTQLYNIGNKQCKILMTGFIAGFKQAQN